MLKTPTCYEVIGDLHDAISSQLPEGVEYLVLGGIASAALRHPETQIHQDDKTIVAASDSAEPIIRDNKTRRDVDILVTSVLDEVAGEKIKTAVEEVAEKKLEVSIFSYRVHAEESLLIPPKKSIRDSFLSRRTIDAEGVLRYELNPLSQVVDPVTYEPWDLVLPRGQKVKVLNPVGHILAYYMRSISGLRPKDAPKVEEMIANVDSKTEDIAEIAEDQFGTWIDFIYAAHELRQGRRPSAESLKRDATKVELGSFRIKARLLRPIERRKSLVNIGQTAAVQKILKPFVHSK